MLRRCAAVPADDGGNASPDSADAQQYTSLAGISYPAASTARTLYITTYALDGTAGAVLITPAGDMYAFGPNLNDTRAYTSLAGITFPAGS